MPQPHPPHWTSPTLPAYLLIDEAADLLRTPLTTLYRWRQEGTGPPAIKVGRKLLYPRSDLMAWLDAQVASG